MQILLVEKQGVTSVFINRFNNLGVAIKAMHSLFGKRTIRMMPEAKKIYSDVRLNIAYTGKRYFLVLAEDGSYDGDIFFYSENRGPEVILHFITDTLLKAARSCARSEDGQQLKPGADIHPGVSWENVPV